MKKNRISRITALGVLAATLAATVMPVAAAESVDQTVKSEEVTQNSTNNSKYPQLEEFTAQTLYDEEFTQEDLAEKDVTILYIWSTTCGYCVEEMPDLKEYAQELPENVQLITYCADGAYLGFSAKKIVEKNELTDYATLITAEGDLADLLSQIMYTPTTLFLDKEGNVVGDAIVGAPKDLKETYDEALEAVLEQIEVTEEVQEETTNEK